MATKKKATRAIRVPKEAVEHFEECVEESRRRDEVSRRAQYSILLSGVASRALERAVTEAETSAAKAAGLNLTISPSVILENLVRRHLSTPADRRDHRRHVATELGYLS